jgi:GNAT superfamily N-acetyltransferase
MNIYHSYGIAIERREEGNTISFQMKRGMDNMGVITIVPLLEEEYRVYDTRSMSIQHKNGLYVSWIEIKEAYQRKGYATLLLLYALCTLYAESDYPLEFISLEDATDNQLYMDTNIYNKLGFTHKGYVEINNSKKKLIRGVNADGAKETTFDHLFTVIQNKLNKRNGSMNRKKHMGGTRRKRRTRR